MKWKNLEQDFVLGDSRKISVLNLIWHTTPRSDANWLEACSLRPMNIMISEVQPTEVATIHTEATKVMPSEQGG